MAVLVSKKHILQRLSEVIDPELGINIVDLGLIYEVNIGNVPFGAKPETGDAKLKTTKENYVEVKMTLTSMGCPLAGFFAMQVEGKVKEIKGVKDVHVHVVWDPPWTPEKMAPKAKMMLGMK